MLPVLFAGCGSGVISTSPPALTSGVASTQNRQVPGDATFRSLAVGRRPNIISPQVRVEAQTAGLLFVADAANNVVAIYSKHNPTSPIGTITDGMADPEEIAVDDAANLYVANLSNGSVTVYAPPYTAPPLRTYTSGLTYPFSVTVGKDGTVYVSDNPNGSIGQVVEYAPNQMTPSLTIPIVGYVEGVALDQRDRLYVGFNGQTGDVLRFESHSNHRTNLHLPIQFVSGIVIGYDGTLLAEDQIPAAVDAFDRGSWQPSQVINNGGNGFGDPVSIALGTFERRLYIGDGMNDVVDIVDYPSGKTVGTIGGFGRVHGVAVSPPAPK